MLSDAGQAKLGFVKDMRSDKVYLQDCDVYLEVCKAHDSSLKVINIAGAFSGQGCTHKVLSDKSFGTLIAKMHAAAREGHKDSTCTSAMR